MKIPCELVVWHVLPIIRRDVARELVKTHGIQQSEVAKKFGLTDAAISQYIKKKRGDNQFIENSPYYEMFEKEVKESAMRIVNEESDFPAEMCRICMVMKSSGMLAMIYREKFGCKPPACVCERVVKI